MDVIHKWADITDKTQNMKGFENLQQIPKNESFY